METVIDYAEKRLKTCEDYDKAYWAAYLDGARAQKREFEKCGAGENGVTPDIYDKCGTGENGVIPDTDVYVRRKTMRTAERFNELRKKVMKAIGKQLEKDSGCKSYEGTFAWTSCYPDYFEDDTGDKGPDFYVLELHCYVLGPGRHYEWRGKTRQEVLEQAEKEIGSWLAEEDEHD